MTGASVGALNGALIAQGDFDTAERLWLELETSHVFDVKLDETLPPDKKLLSAAVEFGRAAVTQGGAGATALAGILARLLDENKVRQSPIDFGIVTVRLSPPAVLHLWQEQMPEGTLSDYLLASSAVFPAVKPKEIEGALYIDGGYSDSMPVRMAIDRGAERIIAVNIEAFGVIRRESAFKNYDLREIKSYWDLGNILLFDPSSARANMRLGYLDTMRSYGVYDGFAYAFIKGELGKIARQHYSELNRLMGLIGFPRDSREFVSTLAVNALEKRMARRGLRPNKRGFALDGMENAAEIFALPAGTLYRADLFFERLSEVIAAAPVPPATLEGAITEVLTGLLDRRARVLLLARLLRECFAGTRTLNLAPFAALMPDEFTAGLFLALCI